MIHQLKSRKNKKNKNDEKKIKAYFGSMEEYKKIPTTWEEFKIIDLNVENPKILDHGYDEKKPESEIDAA